MNYDGWIGISLLFEGAYVAALLLIAIGITLAVLAFTGEGR